MVASELTKIVRAGFEKLCVEFTDRIAPHGFLRTRKTFWTRAHPLFVDVVHFHREGSSYAPTSASVGVRIHPAMRVLNDDLVAVELNGRSTDKFLGDRPGYHLSFNARSLSQYDRCVTDTVRFFDEQALPWFAAFSTVEALLERADSPLMPSARERLRESIASGPEPALVAVSRKLLGIRD
jgi:hypothetical protein